MTAKQEKILAALEKLNGEASAESLAKELGIDVRGLYEYVRPSGLIKKGVISLVDDVYRHILPDPPAGLRK